MTSSVSRLTSLGPRKRTYLALAAVCLAAAGPVQWWAERGRREALGPPPKRLHMVELWPVLIGGFRGPVVAALAYYAQEKEIAADIYSTRSSVRTLLELQPEFDHLWIYYSWVQAYNLVAVLASPEERYVFIRDGMDFLEKGIGRIADLYEGRKRYVNGRCPITQRPIDPRRVTEDLTRQFQGQRVALLDDGAAASWDALSDTDKALRLEPVRDATLEYKRKRATLLYMLGWTCYQKLASGQEAKQYYRRWYIRDTGQDPFQVAFRYLSLASAVDVPPYQVSYHVLKTAPVHCLMDWARALADDPKVAVKVAAEAFERADAAWAKQLPSMPNADKKRIMHSVREMELVTQAMRLMAIADEKASLANREEARAALAGARQRLDILLAEQREGSYQDIYRQRLKWTEERVEKLLRGEIL